MPIDEKEHMHADTKISITYHKSSNLALTICINTNYLS